MTSYVSRDGHWRVSEIVIDRTGHGFETLIRVQHDSCSGIPDHKSKDGPGIRVGPVLGPGGWFLVDDYAKPADAEQWVPFSELIEEGS